MVSLMEHGSEITHFLHHYCPCTGGIESVARAFAENTVKFRKVTVSCLDRCHTKEIRLKSGEIHGIMVRRHGFIDLGLYKISPSGIRDFFGKKILHIHGVGFFLDAAVLTKPFHGNKIVLSTHGGIFHTHSGSAIRRFYFYVCEKFLMNFVDMVIASSRNDVELFSKICPREKIILFENPADVNTSPIHQGKNENQFVFHNPNSPIILLNIFIELPFTFWVNSAFALDV